MDYAYKRETLDNGLRLLWMELPHVHSVSLHAYVATGPAYETRENNGVSHLLEHLHMAATPRYPTRAELTEAFARLPLNRDAETQPDLLAFTLDGAPQILGQAAELLAELLTIHSYPPEIIESERRLLIAELSATHGYEERWLRLLFGKHPFGLPPGGSSRSVARLSIEQIEQFDQVSFAPRRIVVAVVGKVIPRERDRTRACLTDLRGTAQLRLQEPAPPILQLPMFRCWDALGRVRGGVTLGFVRQEPLTHKARIAQSVIGGWLSSSEAQLHERLRYSADSTYVFDNDIHRVRDTTVFYFWALAHARQRDALVKTVLEEIADLRRKQLVGEWLPIVRAKYRFGVEYCLDAPQALAHRIGTPEAAGRKEPAMTIEEELAVLGELGPDDVTDFADRYLSRRHLFGFFEPRTRFFDAGRFRNLVCQYLE